MSQYRNQNQTSNQHLLSYLEDSSNLTSEKSVDYDNVVIEDTLEDEDKSISFSNMSNVSHNNSEHLSEGGPKILANRLINKLAGKVINDSPLINSPNVNQNQTSSLDIEDSMKMVDSEVFPQYGKKANVLSQNSVVKNKASTKSAAQVINLDSSGSDKENDESMFSVNKKKQAANVISSSDNDDEDEDEDEDEDKDEDEDEEEDEDKEEEEDNDENDPEKTSDDNRRSKDISSASMNEESSNESMVNKPNVKKFEISSVPNDRLYKKSESMSSTSSARTSTSSRISSSANSGKDKYTEFNETESNASSEEIIKKPKGVKKMLSSSDDENQNEDVEEAASQEDHRNEMQGEASKSKTDSLGSIDFKKQEDNDEEYERVKEKQGPRRKSMSIERKNDISSDEFFKDFKNILREIKNEKKNFYKKFTVTYEEKYVSKPLPPSNEDENNSEPSTPTQAPIDQQHQRNKNQLQRQLNIGSPEEYKTPGIFPSPRTNSKKTIDDDSIQEVSPQYESTINTSVNVDRKTKHDEKTPSYIPSPGHFRELKQPLAAKSTTPVAVKTESQSKLDAIKMKLAQSKLEKENALRKMKLIENKKDEDDVICISDGEKNSKLNEMKEERPAKEMFPENDMKFFDRNLMRGTNTQMDNRNLSFEDQLKKVYGYMMSLLDQKPADTQEYDESMIMPNGLKVRLLDHQCHSLQWLKWREANAPFGGILADDMGLGKTLTVLAYLKIVKDTKEAKAMAKLIEKEEKKKKAQNLNDSDEQEDEKIYKKSSKYKYKDDDEDDEDDEEIRSLNAYTAIKKKHTSHSSRDISYRLRTLVVLPASLLYQWENEIKSKFKRESFKYHIYHDANRKKYAYNLEDNDIVFTTYEIVSREIEIPDKDGFVKSSDSPLSKVKWKRIILDEAHRIKNHTTKVSKAVSSLKASYRIAITGTPIHNSLDDFYSLCKFLQFEPFNDMHLWHYIFSVEKPTSKNVKPSAISEIRKNRSDRWLVILSKYLILRRAKTDTIKGTTKKIVNLPEKKIEIVKFRLNEAEKMIYDSIFEESKKKVDQMLKDHQRRLLGKTTNSARSMHEILVYILRLRQACCHMSLLAECLDKDELQNMRLESNEGDETQQLEAGIENLTIKESTNTSNASDESKIFTNFQNQTIFDSDFNLSLCVEKSFKSSKLTMVVEATDHVLNENPDDKLIIVSQWTSVLKIIADNFKERNIDFCEIKGDIKLEQRNEIVQHFNMPASKVPTRVMLLSLAAGGVGLNLVGANRMFIVDIHWNPALEQQACDRIFRVGQTKDVFIYRFLCEHTIEERIHQVQQTKIQLAERVCNGTLSASNVKLGINDIKNIFERFEEDEKNSGVK